MITVYPPPLSPPATGVSIYRCRRGNPSMERTAMRSRQARMSRNEHVTADSNGTRAVPEPLDTGPVSPPGRTAVICADQNVFSSTRRIVTRTSR